MPPASLCKDCKVSTFRMIQGEKHTQRLKFCLSFDHFFFRLCRDVDGFVEQCERFRKGLSVIISILQTGKQL